MAVTRVEERLLASLGLVQVNPVRFECCRGIAYGGVMLLLPFLIECGLLSYREYYQQRQGGYYNFDNLFIVLAFMGLCRIKSFEQSKYVSPGDWGKMVGYDRIPGVKKLRGSVREITAQERCAQWSAGLSGQWVDEEEPGLYYVDGHVQVYHGSLAELGKKHVSRQRLCLPGMMEFWVNSPAGMPYFFVMAEVNEKMGEMLLSDIIPRLLELHPVSEGQRQLMEADPDYPLFTLVFDREAYSPALFKRLWEEYRIAAVTYRKNVKDKWDEDLFVEQAVEAGFGPAQMELCEQAATIDGFTFREVRKLSGDKHQTSIITTNKIISIALIAAYMFGRWIQENFFRFMRQEYALDKIIQYGIGQIDDNFMVVSREYNNINRRIKSEREKQKRLQAKLYIHQEQMPGMEDMGSKKMAKWLEVSANLSQQIGNVEEKIGQLVQERSATPCMIPVSQMPPESRYTKLDQGANTS